MYDFEIIAATLIMTVLEIISVKSIYVTCEAGQRTPSTTSLLQKVYNRKALFIVTPIVGACNCSMFCCTLLYVHSSIAIILTEKRELVALLNLSSWCLVMVERLFLAVPRGCLRFVIVVFPDHTHLLFLMTQLGFSNR